MTFIRVLDSGPNAQSGGSKIDLLPAFYRRKEFILFAAAFDLTTQQSEKFHELLL